MHDLKPENALIQVRDLIGEYTIIHVWVSKPFYGEIKFFFHLKLFLLDILWNIDSFNSATEKKEMTGLAIGVSSMKAGEHALLHVGWELGYGKEGSFSFPNVSPMADLVYEVVLIGFDKTKEVSCSEWLFFPEIDRGWSM